MLMGVAIITKYMVDSYKRRLQLDSISQLLNAGKCIYIFLIFGNIAIFYWTIHHPRNIAFLTPIIITCEYTAKIETTTLTYETKMSAKIETLMVSHEAKMSHNHI